jgi:hypothetical protein
MKTKTLLIAAATLAVGVIASQAAVYSANVVGYVNLLVVSNGYTAINFPVDYDGSGTNNQVSLVIGTNLPFNSVVQAWNGTGYVPNSYTKKSGWANPTAKYNPGQGVFIFNPSNAVTLTFVGTVLQGGLTNGYLTGAGYSLLGNQFPVAGGITTTYGYVPSFGDVVQTWSNGFTPNSYTKKSGWALGEPQLGVGQAVFLNTTNQHPVWGTNFVIPTP